MKSLEKLQKKIGIEFKNKDLLKVALSHRSILNEDKRFKESNERLEFLGDSILSFIVAEYLYLNYPEIEEGDASNIRASLVSKDALAEVAREITLGEYLFLSKGEEKVGGRNNPAILSDALEALIGAIYLDKGLEVVKQFIVKFILEPKIDAILNKGRYASSKTQLQEFLQEKFKTLPEYRVLREEGPDHAKKYTVGVFIKDKKLAEATASSKKSAEKKAAELALKKLHSESSDV